MKRIAIQGLIGSFHDIAAHLYFEDEQIQLICCSTFEEVFQQMKQDPTAIGMLAIENTIAGSLLHNYELLRDSVIINKFRLQLEDIVVIASINFQGIKHFIIGMVFANEW